MNDYFKFKQFTIYQNNCAMKVCTDACIFGAWAAHIVKQLHPSTVLDIGAGTGLLTLMLAQQYTAHYTAIEIEDAAALQCKQNIESANFSSKFEIINANIKNLSGTKKFDFIITNPPFYENQLAADSINKNLALHDAGLTLDDTLSSIKQHLNINGLATLLMPYQRLAETIYKLEEFGLFANEIVHVRHNARKLPFRFLMLISYAKIKVKESTLTIKEKDNTYSENFKQLLQDYYLYL
jgi:tRNA1Val (adenine37-N6)-methyltransferase